MIVRKNILVVFLFLCLTGARVFAQTDPVQPEKYRKFALYLGAGPSYFFNNVVTFKNDVNSLNYGITFRAMWEPKGSVLALGIESGYYRLYSVHTDDPKATVINTAVPLQLVISAKFLKTWYASFSLGQSFLYNKVKAPDYSGNYSAHKVSLADLGLAAGYRIATRGRLSYSAELKYFFSSQNRDMTLSAFFVVGYRL